MPGEARCQANLFGRSGSIAGLYVAAPRPHSKNPGRHLSGAAELEASRVVIHRIMQSQRSTNKKLFEQRAIQSHYSTHRPKFGRRSQQSAGLRSSFFNLSKYPAATLIMSRFLVLTQLENPQRLSTSHYIAVRTEFRIPTSRVVSGMPCHHTDIRSLVTALTRCKADR
jgi:hypothetical protein